MKCVSWDSCHPELQCVVRQTRQIMNTYQWFTLGNITRLDNEVMDASGPNKMHSMLKSAIEVLR